MGTTPVTLMIDDQRRWLVSPYGDVAWSRKVRAAGRARLIRGKRSEEVRTVDLGPKESAPILNRYLTEVCIVQPFFTARPDSR